MGKEVVVCSYSTTDITLNIMGSRYHYIVDSSFIIKKALKLIEFGAGYKAVNYLKRFHKGIPLSKGCYNKDVVKSIIHQLGGINERQRDSRHS